LKEPSTPRSLLIPDSLGLKGVKYNAPGGAVLVMGVVRNNVQELE